MDFLPLQREDAPGTGWSSSKPTIRRKADGVPGNFNVWGERSCPEYSLLKRSFGTCTRGLPANDEAQNG